LAAYEERYRAACAKFAVRDPNPDGDWTSEHDCLSEALADQHAVYGALMAETTFKIIEVLAPVLESKVRRAEFGALPDGALGAALHNCPKCGRGT